MATRKKKTTVIESAEVAEMTNVPSGGWPKILQGSHLTVKTFEDGRTELVWDDEALIRDVREAILKAESVLPVADAKPKRTSKKKQTE
jgi:hypothetical protein